eukprot:gene14139-20102_t
MTVWCQVVTCASWSGAIGRHRPRALHRAWSLAILDARLRKYFGTVLASFDSDFVEYAFQHEERQQGGNAAVEDESTEASPTGSGGECKKVVVFTGSGISATSGMSMFSTRNGLYERAKKRFKISDGIKLFTYSFYKQRRADVQAFFAQIYSEAQGSKAAPGHHALAGIHEIQRIKRHYTLNIDGLAEVVGLDTWHHERHPAGVTVEMHGNIRQLVCPSCHAVEDLVMLYDDDQGACITPEHVFEVLEEDLEEADLVLWVGISFEQSASVEYFRRVRHILGLNGRLHIKQAIINPSDDAYFNLMSSCCNTDELELMNVTGSSDLVLPTLADFMRADLAGGSPEPAILEAVANLDAAAGNGLGRNSPRMGGSLRGLKRAEDATMELESDEEEKGSARKAKKEEADSDSDRDSGLRPKSARSRLGLGGEKSSSAKRARGRLHKVGRVGDDTYDGLQPETLGEFQEIGDEVLGGMFEVAIASNNGQANPLLPLQADGLCRQFQMGSKDLLPPGRLLKGDVHLAGMQVGQQQELQGEQVQALAPEVASRILKQMLESYKNSPTGDAAAPLASHPAEQATLVGSEQLLGSYQLPTPAGSGYPLPTPCGSGYQLPTPDGSGYQLLTPAGSGYQLITPVGSDFQLPTPAGSGYQLPTPAGSGYQLPTPAGSGYQLPTLATTSYQLPTPAEIGLDLTSLSHQVCSPQRGNSASLIASQSALQLLGSQQLLSQQPHATLLGSPQLKKESNLGLALSPQHSILSGSIGTLHGSAADLSSLPTVSGSQGHASGLLDGSHQGGRLTNTLGSSRNVALLNIFDGQHKAEGGQSAVRRMGAVAQPTMPVLDFGKPATRVTPLSLPMHPASSPAGLDLARLSDPGSSIMANSVRNFGMPGKLQGQGPESSGEALMGGSIRNFGMPAKLQGQGPESSGEAGQWQPSSQSQTHAPAYLSSEEGRGQPSSQSQTHAPVYLSSAQGQGQPGSQSQTHAPVYLSSAQGQGQPGSQSQTHAPVYLSSAQGQGQPGSQSQTHAPVYLSSAQGQGQPSSQSLPHAPVYLSMARGHGQSSSPSLPHAPAYFSSAQGEGQGQPSSHSLPHAHVYISSAQGEGQGQASSQSLPHAPVYLSMAHGQGQPSSPSLSHAPVYFSSAQGEGQPSSQSLPHAPVYLSLAQGMNNVQQGMSIQQHLAMQHHLQGIPHQDPNAHQLTQMASNSTLQQQHRPN